MSGFSVTKAGHELARKFRAVLTDDQLETCSRICRRAATYRRIQEQWCSDERTADPESRFSKRLRDEESSIETFVQKLAATLPGIVDVKFGGDPRGYTIKLIASDTSLHDDWGREGIGVPNS